MSDNRVDIGQATGIAKDYVKQYSEGDWEKVTDASITAGQVTVEFKTSTSSRHREITVDQETGNIVSINF